MEDFSLSTCSWQDFWTWNSRIHKSGMDIYGPERRVSFDEYYGKFAQTIHGAMGYRRDQAEY